MVELIYISTSSVDPVKFVVLLYAQASLDISFFILMASPGTGGMNAATAVAAPGSLLRFFDDHLLH